MRQQLSIMTLSNFMPSLSSSIKFLILFSSYMLLPVSETSSLPTSIYSIALPWQFSLAPKIASGPRNDPSKNCIAHYYFLCQFSQSRWSPLLVIIWAFYSISSTYNVLGGVILWLGVSFEPTPKPQLWYSSNCRLSDSPKEKSPEITSL